MAGQDRLTTAGNRLGQLGAFESTQHGEPLHLTDLLVDPFRQVIVEIPQLFGHPLLLDAGTDAGMQQHRVERLR